MKTQLLFTHSHADVQWDEIFHKTFLELHSKTLLLQDSLRKLNDMGTCFRRSKETHNKSFQKPNNPTLKKKKQATEFLPSF